MISQETYRILRAGIIVVSLTFGTGVFWSFLFAEAIRYLFHLNENRTLIFAGGPFFVAYCIWCTKHLPTALRKAGYVE